MHSSSDTDHEEEHNFYLRKRFFRYANLDTISIIQSYLSVEGTGGAVYDSADNLCKCLCSTLRECVEGRRLLEVGAGVGLVSVVASLLGAQQVVATDCDPALLDIIRQNIRNNCSQPSEVEGLEGTACSTVIPQVESFLWESDDDMERVASLFKNIEETSGQEEVKRLDSILCSDIIYNSEVIDAFEGMLKRFFEILNYMPEIIIGYEERYYDEEQRFFKEMEKVGYVIAKISSNSAENSSNDNHLIVVHMVPSI
mmetsp:Transcript_19966/g.26355  ORF Transcript_19966/g.26355 Transcript_19966/m.26355 type:complete len:255 (-) Transcript_19966:409-1173(-)